MTKVDQVLGLTEAGYGERGILTLAIAHSNFWARLYRMPILDTDLFYLNIGIV